MEIDKSKLFLPRDEYFKSYLYLYPTIDDLLDKRIELCKEICLQDLLLVELVAYNPLTNERIVKKMHAKTNIDGYILIKGDMLVNCTIPEMDRIKQARLTFQEIFISVEEYELKQEKAREERQRYEKEQQQKREAWILY